MADAAPSKTYQWSWERRKIGWWLFCALWRPLGHVGNAIFGGDFAHEWGVEYIKYWPSYYWPVRIKQ